MENDKRNYGIDLLRVVAMFFVIVLHSFGQGGILNSATIGSSQYKIAWFIEIFAYCAVDVFAIISGYVCYSEENKKIKFSRYINLWLQVVFYGLLINLVCSFIRPELITGDSYLKVLFPVSNHLYWYFTAYTGVFLFMPLINNAIKNSDNNLLKKTLVLIFMVFSIFHLFFKPFFLNKGYSFVWILLLYIIGAIMKKCEIGKNLKKGYAIIRILLLVVITYLYKMYGYTNDTITKDIFVSYISPTILGTSILYVILFSKMKFNNFFKKIIKFMGVSAFSIYLINNHEIIYDNNMKMLFAKLATGGRLRLILQPLIFSILFVVGAILIDKIRILLFKLLRIEKLSKFIEEKTDKFLDIVVRDKKRGSNF